MAELAALNIKITGDSGDLQAAIAAANGDLAKLVAGAQAAGLKVSKIPFKPAQDGAGKFSNSIRGVTQQLSQVGQQTMATGNFLQALAIQLPDIGLAFGTIGTAAGLLAGIALPMLAAAFTSTAEDADKLSAAAEYQKGVLDNLTQATYALRLERQMLQSGAILTEEQEAMNEIVRLGYERVGLEQALADEIAKANDAMGVINQAAVDAIRLKLEENAATQDQARALLENARLERAKIEAINLAKAAQDKVLAVMRQLNNSSISSPWETVLGAIQAAIDKAGEYARTAGFGMTYGNSNFTKGKMGFTLPGNELLPPEAPGAGGGGGGGGAAVNPIQTELEALQEGLMTQEQLQLESYTRQQETLKQALDARLLSQQDYANLMEQVEATHQAKMGSQMREGVATTIGALSQLFNKSKPLAIASALVNTWQGMTEALKLPFPKNIAAAATTLATGMNAVRNIKSTSPGGGGSTSGSIGAGGASAAAAAAPQQNVQTLNFTLTNDSFGIGQNLVRQIASQLNEASRNGSTLIRATVS